MIAQGLFKVGIVQLILLMEHQTVQLFAEMVSFTIIPTTYIMRPVMMGTQLITKVAQVIVKEFYLSGNVLEDQVQLSQYVSLFVKMEMLL